MKLKCWFIKLNEVVTIYKIVIGDDEQIVREGIKNLIDWNSLGLEFIGDAENGQELYELIKKNKPDIAMVDICMPQVDGLKLCKMLRDENIDCEIIIVTGYDEFTYAREALRLGVKDYILKPLTRNEIYEILQDIVASLDEKKKQTDELEDKIKESMEVKQQRLLNRLIYGDMILELVNKDMDDTQFLFNFKWYSICILDMDDLLKSSAGSKEDEIKLTNFAVYNIAAEVAANTNGVVFRTEENEIAVLCCSHNEDMSMALEEFKDIMQRIKELFRKHLKITVSAGIGTLTKNVDGISESYYSARKAIAYRFFYGKDLLIYGDELNSENKTGAEGFSEIEKALIGFIKELDDSKVLKELENLSGYMKLQKIDRSICIDVWVKLFILMFQAIRNMNIDAAKAVEGKSKISEKINELKNIDDIKNWFFTSYKMCSDYIKSHSDTNKIYVSNIEDYLSKNYSNGELNFDDLCRFIHLSPSYLATIFKNELGKTFIEYLTDIRIQKSIELLRSSNLKIYEIAEAVGYPNSHYFSSLFKKMFGESPSDYRNYMH